MSKSKRSSYVTDDFEPPEKQLVSDADLFIKNLAKKQQNTTIDLQCELANKKEFCKGTELVSLAHYNAGCSSLEEFQESTAYLEHVSFLRSVGLSESEIELYLDYLKGEDHLFNKHKNCEKIMLRKTINGIQDIIRKHKEKQSTISKDTELKPLDDDRSNTGLCIKPCSEATKLYKFALENEKLKKKCSIPSPMDNIKDIEANFLKTLQTQELPNINQIRRKARKLFNRSCRTNEVGNYQSGNDDIKSTSTNHNNPYIKKSKWDSKIETVTHPKVVTKQLHTCSPQNYYTIKNGIIVKLNKTECEERELPIPKRLTIDEIKEIPKFQDYKRGSPSQTLYLKNLGNNVKESDLKMLFKDYERIGEVTCKLMNGKMRGQAFITFKDEMVASQALEDVNGVFLKNRPVIIQFGYGKLL